MMNIRIPKLDCFEDVDAKIVGKPGWIPMKNAAGNEIKPVIRCNCGSWRGLQDHQIHSDGRVSPAFYHKPDAFNVLDGCKWLVFLTLANWTGSVFPSGQW
jgi:hypothetical protein